MSNEKQAVNNEPLKEKQENEEKQKPSKRVWFCCIVQADFPDQMEVLRYMSAHPEQFPCMISILHDKDTFSEDDEEDAGKFKNGVYVRKNADGTQSEFHFGDVKPAHYHVMFKMPRKVLASSLTKQFCRQVTIMDCSNEIGYAHYLTHNVFHARKRYQYAPDAVCMCEFTNRKGISVYIDLTEQSGMDFSDICSEWVKVLREAEGDMTHAVEILCSGGENEVLKKIAAHSNFFDKFFKHN